MNSSGSAASPDAPLASSITVSLVDMQPSESVRSKVNDVAVVRALASSSAATTASVVITTSMVARAGASMPAPFAMPPIAQWCGEWYSAVLGTVSVVMIASAAAGPPSSDRSWVASSMPASTLSMGSRTPISPVEQTATSVTSAPIASAVHSAICRASARPARPVQALAPPELSTTAASRPSATASRDHSTGAALNALLVNTAAAWASGPLLTTRARSGRPDALMPAVTPAAVKPLGVVTLTVLLRSW